MPLSRKLRGRKMPRRHLRAAILASRSVISIDRDERAVVFLLDLTRPENVK
jgi:hypothetical protein